MLKLTQYLTVKKQIESFEVLGFKARFEIQNICKHYITIIILCKDKTFYQFVEPDFDLIVLQLARLYLSLR